MDGVQAVGQDESLVMRSAMWLDGERHWLEICSFNAAMADGDDIVLQCFVAQLRQLRRGVQFSFPARFKLPPLRVAVGLLDLCNDKLELVDFLCLGGAAASVAWPFPVGGPSGAWRRAPMCASSAAHSDFSVAWRCTERAKQKVLTIYEQLCAGGSRLTLGDIEGELRSVGLNPNRILRGTPRQFITPTCSTTSSRAVPCVSTAACCISTGSESSDTTPSCAAFARCRGRHSERSTCN
jgi:hypothetical protein